MPDSGSFFSKENAQSMSTKKPQPPTLVGIVKGKDFCFGNTPDDVLLLDCGRSLRSVNIHYEKPNHSRL